MVELLAPAGSWEALYGGVKNGADAVYLGGKLFNARHYASNFDNEEIKKIVDYCHLRGVKVYLTVNILIGDSEINQALAYISFLNDLGIDGLIIQDLGLAKEIRQLFPDLRLHASTQMSIHNSEGAKYLKELGFKRVVLARELSLDEIKDIRENVDIELEVFVHGALCISYSGQCLMSSLIGGRSGNRGRCAQPCRMKQEIIKDGKILKESAYLLSPKDLKTIEFLDQLEDTGIDSLKIEGRMKKAEYVSTIVGRYKEALEKGYKSLKEEELLDIEQVFSRGFTQGIGRGDFGKDLIVESKPNNKGIYFAQAYSKGEKTEILAKYNSRAGDLLELESEGGENVRYRLEKDIKAGQRIEIDIKRIKNNTPVYRLESQELIERIEASNREKSLAEAIDIDMEVLRGKKPRLSIKFRDIRVSLEGDQEVEESRNIPLDREKIFEQINKTDQSPFYIRDFNLRLDEGSFLPLSALNKLRRDGLKLLEEKILEEYRGKRRSFYQKDKDYLDIESRRDFKRQISVKLDSLDQLKKIDFNQADRIYLDYYQGLDESFEILKNFKGEIGLGTGKILKKDSMKRLREILDIYQGQIDGIIGHGLAIYELANQYPNLDFYGDYGLNLFNSLSISALEKAKSLCLSAELNLEEIRRLKKASPLMEIVAYGHLELMTSDYCPMSLVIDCDRVCENCGLGKSYHIRDRVGASFPVKRKNNMTLIYNSRPNFLADQVERIYSSGVDILRLDFTVEEDPASILDLYYQLINKNLSREEERARIEEIRKNKEITRGHLFRGVLGEE